MSNLKWYVEIVLNNFKKSEAQGYHTKDREYVITMLEKGLEVESNLSKGTDASIIDELSNRPKDIMK